MCGLQKTCGGCIISNFTRETQEESVERASYIVVSKGCVKGNRKGDGKNQGSGGTAHYSLHP